MAQYAYPTMAELELVNLLKVPFATASIALTSSAFSPGSAYDTGRIDRYRSYVHRILSHHTYHHSGRVH